ncbi:MULTISPECIES: ArnT family glycosyltransferase [Candidatus Nitrosocaldus]|uniref:ArnT family glycosyltransferase n=1 Tax=Candidatus Nitrosocaldus TaxID=498374 RepID=UPI0013158B79|nr:MULTISPECIES: glycosyltransferase family 39 protein [Candidatus Nitrosocaldus]
MRNEWFIPLSVAVVGIVTSLLLLYSHDGYALLYYGDSVSHLVGSRKIVDWENPGLEQIGTVWLPLPHILFLVPSLIDPLFTTGLAGTVISLPSLAFTTLLIYRVMRDQGSIIHPSTKDHRIAYLLALLYAFNPNMMYLGIVAMTEALFMLFLVASIYYFQRWLLQGCSTRNLLLCSLFISLATLCRYESWFLPILLIAVVFTSAVRNRSKDNELQLLPIITSLLSTTGIAIWLAWNYYIYGDPFEFSNAEYYSAAWYAIHNQYHERYFMNPLNVFSVYMYNTIHLYGPLLLTGITGGYSIYHRSAKDRMGVMMIIILLLFLLLPPTFTIVSMLIGVGEMDYAYNSRFTILLAPLLFITTFLFLNRLSVYRWYIITPLLLLLVLWNPLFLRLGVVTYIDAYAGYSTKDTQLAVDAGEALRSLYDRGRIMILAGSILEHRIMITSNIALNRFDEMADHSTWKDSFKSPWLYDRWLIISKRPVHDATNVITHWLEREEELLMHYKVVYENENYKIMRLIVLVTINEYYSNNSNSSSSNRQESLFYNAPTYPR